MLILAALLWPKRQRYPRLWKVSVFLVALVIFQGVLGGLTVIMLLNPFIVTAHLAAGTLFFVSLVLVAGDKPGEGLKVSQGYRRFVWSFVVLVYAQMVLGAFVGSSGASLACLDFPACAAGSWFGSGGGAQAVHMAHRIAALLVAFWALLFYLRARRESAVSPAVGAAVSFLVAVQICVGIANVLFRVPVPNAVLHLVIAECILMLLALHLRNLYSSSGLFAEVGRPEPEAEARRAA